MKRYLIVGSSGFVGSNILSILPSNIDILIITSNKKIVSEKIKKKKFSKYLIKDYAFITAKNKKIIQEMDVIINCTGAYPKKNNTKKLIFLNYKFPKLLFDLSLNKKLKHFININTLLKNKKSIYVKYKHKLSDYFKKNLGNTDVTDLYVAHLYGDIENKKEFIYQMIIKILKKEKTLNLTKGQQKRDFIHIKDFKRFFLEILKKKVIRGYSKLEIGNYKSHSIKSVILFIKKITSSDININFGFYNYKKGEDFKMKSSIKTLGNVNWRPKIILTRGVKLLIKNIKKIHKPL